MDILNKFKVASEQLGSDAYENLIATKQALSRDMTVVGFMGTANVGKTTVINAIAGTSLSVSNIPSMDNHLILPEGSIGSDIISKEPWVKNNNIALFEKVERTFSSTSTDADFCDYFSDIDICVYLIDAQMAFTNNDALILEHLTKFGVPTIVCVSKYEKLQADTRHEVHAYLSKKISTGNNIYYIENDECRPLIEIIDSIKDGIVSANSTELISQTRNSMLSFAVMNAVASLYEDCQQKIAVAAEGVKKVEEMTAEKITKLSAKEADWMRIELELVNRRQETEEKIRTRLASRKEDMLRRLEHDVENTGDVKSYWEKELCYRIDDMMRSELQSCTQILNSSVMNTLKWMQDEILKSFKKQSGFVPSIVCTIDNEETKLESIVIPDNKKLKIIIRIGTVATVIAAGTLLATSGVAGVVMAISMLSGLSADWLMGKKNQEASEKVKEVLPTILDRSELVYINQISESLKVSYNEIIQNVKIKKAEWKEKATLEIEEERQIALHNSHLATYEKVLDDLNLISSYLIAGEE